MLKLHIPPLDEQHQADLQALQDKVNQQADYAAQVAYAKEHWRKKPAALFADHLKPQLAAPLSGNGRCVYCEGSWADQIEHMRPKDFFPEQTYVWDNYVLACGPCNGSHKRNQFALLLANGELHELPRRPRGSLSSGCQRGEKSGYTLPGVGAWAPPRMACIDAAPGVGCGERVPLLG